MTNARPAATQIHQGISTPYLAFIAGSRTSWARIDRVSAPTGGSQIENRTPAKKPARGWKVRAIHVYHPPADGNTFANWAAFSACSARSPPPNRYAHGVTTPALLTMNTNDARIANAGAIVAIPCISIPGRPTAFSRNSVLTVPWPVSPVSIATVRTPSCPLVTAGPRPCTQLCLAIVPRSASVMPTFAVWPPSTGNTAPVTYDASSEARKGAGAASSSGLASRPIGIASPNLRISSSVMTDPSIGVAVGPGASAFTLIPPAAWSIASALVSIATPPFDVTYATFPGEASCAPVEDDTVMIEPPPRSAMGPMTARAARKVPVRLMAITRFQAFGSVCVAEPNDSTPAAVIRMSTPPNSAMTPAAIASTCAGSDTSTAMATARPPLATISAATCSALSAATSATSTSAPSAANLSAAALEPEIVDAEGGPQREATVDDHVLARHIGSVVGRQEHHDLRNVVGRAVPPSRDPLEVIRTGNRVMDERGRQPGVDDSRVNRVDPDAVPGQVYRRVPDEHDDAALGRAVRRVGLLGEERVRRREHHDRPAAALGHDPAGCPGGKEHPGEVDVDDPPPGALVELENRLQLHDARGMHQHVQAAEPGDRGIDRPLHIGSDRHIPRHGLDAVPVGLQPGRGGLDRVSFDVEQRQVRSLGREPRSTGKAHALGAAHDENRLAGEPGHAAPPCRPAETRIFTWSPAGSARRSMPSRTIWCIAIRLVMTLSTGRAPAAIWARMRGVSQILKDQTPATVRSRQTHPSGWTVRSPRCSAMTAIVAARRTAATQASSPAWLPEHSMAQSAPMPLVRSSTSRATSAEPGSKVAEAPFRSATARRPACGSETKTCPAPAAAAASIASWPIGPPPVISTLSPGRRPERSTPCTTVANGSSTAACSNDTSSGSRTAWDAGTTACSASPPHGQVTPVSLRLEHSPCLPRRQ